MIIQVSMSGYGNNGAEPVTLLGSLDDNTGILVVLKAEAYTSEPLQNGVAFVTATDASRIDWRFQDGDIEDSIDRYFARRDLKNIVLKPEIARFNPDSKIELDKIDERGKHYRLSPDISNGQIAVIAMAAYADKQNKFEVALDFANSLADMSIYEPFTI